MLLSFSAIYSEAQKSEPSIIMGQEMIDNLEPSVCWRGQKSAQFREVPLKYFHNMEILQVIC